MISVIINQSQSCLELKKTLDSVSNSNSKKSPISHIIINRTGECDGIDEMINKWKDGFNGEIEINDLPDTGKYSGYAKALANVDTEYVIFANDGDTFNIVNIDRVCDFLNANKVQISIASFDSSYADETLCNPVFSSNAFSDSSTKVIDLSDNPTAVPTDISGLLLSTKAAKEVGFDEKLKYDAGLLLICELLKRKAKIGRIGGSKYVINSEAVDSKVNNPHVMERGWYFQTLEDFILPLTESYGNVDLPEYLQYAILFQLKSRFVNNINNSNKHIIDDEVDEYFTLVTRAIKKVSNKVIFNYSSNPKYNMTATLRFALLNFKNDCQFNPKFIKDRKSVLMVDENIVIMNLKNQKVMIDLVDFNEDCLIIEGSMDTFFGRENIDLKAFLNAKKVEVLETYRYAHTKYFGRSTHKKYTFRISIPATNLKSNKSEIRFELKVAGYVLPLTMKTQRYTAKVDTRVIGQYWLFKNNYLLKYLNKASTIIIKKVSKKDVIVQELKLLFRMMTGAFRSRKMALIRILYWIVYPVMQNKQIWLTYDKLYKGGDCGEYMYKYMCTRDDSVTPAYVLNGDSPDFTRLKQEGYSPLKYGSLKHKMYYLYSDVVFTTHGGVHSFNDFTDNDVLFIEDLIHHDVACIQHGLTVQQLAFNSNRVFNDMKRYYCASKYEIKNLSHPIYGYEDKSVLKLTGIPRYDGLVNDDRKQILITPTWRNYISMPAASKNDAKPYNPDFINTDYYKIYNELISDNKLVNTAKKCGYKIVYLLHPVISAQIGDYEKREGVEIVPSLEISYEEILRQSSLMVTDYSGVQFDFAFMRKPVVYYHPPELPPHYKEGGFFYDTMGFGEICTNNKSLVDLLCEYMKTNCEVKPFYKSRQDDFFEYSDLNSCQRIYDDMMSFEVNK